MRVQANQPRERKFYKLSGFKGVDYSSSPLEVNPRRATDINNLLLEDGALHKRNGWEQKIKVGNERINGIWKIEDFTYIIKAGQKFYKLEELLYSITELTSFSANDIKSSAFLKDGRLYILDPIGYLVCGKFGDSSTYEVADLRTRIDEVYMPTTTINITARDSVVKAERQVFESPNLICARRKNKLIGEPATRELIYNLDANIRSKLSLTVSIYDKINNLKVEYRLIYADATKKWSNSDGNITAIIENINDEERGVLRIANGYNPFSGQGGTLDQSEITVLFWAQHIDLDYFPFFTNYGAVFGVNGADDRLFLSLEAPDKENIVYFSAKNDFTYFPADNTIACGESGSKITGFSRLGDGTLAVFKDTNDGKNPSVYYITGNFKNLTETVKDSDSEEAFSVTAGGIGESCIAPYAVANLAGDPLMVSRNGVHGIVLSSNVATSERYARERSRPVNAKLEKLDLSDSSAIIYHNRYYLSVGGKNNECYIADARYKYTIQGDMDDTFNYEWFRLTNVPARVWAVIDNELWFGTADGWLCRFTDGYSDIYRTATGEATVAIDENGKKYVTFSSDLYPVISKAIYAMDERKNKWPIEGLTETSFSVPLDISVEVGAITLRFAVPVYASWYSPILDFNASVYRKCLWNMSASVTPVKNGSVAIGYKTRRSIGSLIPVEGAEIFDFGDIDFKRFSFDCGGFISAFRQRVFARDFVYLQVMFEAAEESDCIVNEIMLEYTITTKNIGVG